MTERTRRIATLLAAASLGAVGSSTAGTGADCNGNGTDDFDETVTTFTEILIQAARYPARLADIDTDGDLDILGGGVNVFGFGSGLWETPVTWRENTDGAGTFGPVQSITTEMGDPVAADVDGDGDLDLIVRHDYLSGSQGIRIYENPGDGSFGTFQSQYSLPCTPSESLFWRRLVAGDRDSDGDVDLATPALWCSVAAVISGRNDGGSWTWQTDTTWSGVATQAQIGDLDGDVDADFAVTSFEFIWFEGPDETIENSQPYGDGKYLYDFELVDVDVDGDGDLDAIGDRHECAGCFFRTRELAVFENAAGPGSFEWGQIIAVPSVQDEDTVFATGDLDGNGDPDVVWHETSGEKLQWSLNSNGTFGAPKTPLGQALGGSFPMNIDAGDVDGDGDTDLLVAYYGAGTGDRLVWFRNDGNDCDGDRVPDSCQPDCNGNGIADPCDIRSGSSLDFNGNLVPDECDAPCIEPCDDDGDGCRNGVDVVPDDGAVCGDSDSDGCDDCSNGVYDPDGDGDGANGDTDGVCDLTDCDPANNEAWAGPESTSGLTLVQQGATTELTWQPPANGGGTKLRYDLLRSTSAFDFVSGLTTRCLETDGADQSATDHDALDPNELYHYLVRVENDCPAGSGAMGAGSDGVPRVGRPCDPPAATD